MVKACQSMSKYGFNMLFQRFSDCPEMSRGSLEAEKNSEMGGRPSAACLKLSMAMARCG